MPNFPIVDSHLHIWDPDYIRYPWLDGDPLLNRRYLLSDYEEAFSKVDVEAMIFVQCEADSAHFLKEAEWVASQKSAAIRGMVAWAPLEKGGAVEEDLVKLKRHPELRGIRRIIQFEDDLEFCLRPKFIEGIRMLNQHDLSFDICVDHRHMSNTLKMVEQLPDTKMVLNHIGKPAIAAGEMEPWASQMYELAQHRNVTCKISGVATEAAKEWQVADLTPYLDVAFDSFGFTRTMFGGDWPVTLNAVQPTRWIAILDEYLKGSSPAELKRFWRDNAADFYRVSL